MDAMWQRVWLGLTLPETTSAFPSSLSDDKRASTQRFFGKPIEYVHGSPRPAYKDLIYMLLHWSWPRLWCFVTVVYCSITVLLGLVFYEVCDEVDVFTEGLGMSYQAFSTIGFGIVYPMHRCGNYVIVFEAFASMLMLPAMGGLLFSKLAIPRLRVAFSNVCVLQPNYVDGLPALVFRVANPSPSTRLETDVLLDVRFRAELHSASRLGGNHVLQRFDLPLQQSNFIFFRFALELVHVIDAASPLAPFAAALAADADAMVITLTMEAVDANRHTSVLDQHAYAQADVRVGFRFARMLSPQSAAKLALDFDLLHAVEAAPMVVPPSLLHKPQPATTTTYVQQSAMLSPSRHVEATMEAMLHEALVDDTTHDPRLSIGTENDGYVAMQDDVPLNATTIAPLHAPFAAQYYYHRILSAHWLPVVAEIMVAFLAISVFFGCLHWIQFDEGLYVLNGLTEHHSKFELCFYLSVHTLSTIGYGTIGPAPNDVYHNTIVYTEAVMGLTFAAIFTGICWSKFAKARAHIQFSKSVVVTTVFGQRCLVFRAMNLRNIGEVRQCHFKLGAFLTDENGHRRMMDLALVQPQWTSINVPITLVHCLDAATSPLANLSETELQNLSLLALCSGFDTTFFETVYARHMYFGPSIVLGKDFQDAVALYPDRVVVDTSCFDSLI